jgi:hypothetical protein
MFGVPENCYIVFVIADDVPVGKMFVYTGSKGNFCSVFNKTITDELITAFTEQYDVAFGEAFENHFMYSDITGFTVLGTDFKIILPENEPEELYKITVSHVVYPELYYSAQSGKNTGMSAMSSSTLIGTKDLTIAALDNQKIRGYYCCWMVASVMKIKYQNNLSTAASTMYSNLENNRGYLFDASEIYPGNYQRSQAVYSYFSRSVTTSFLLLTPQQVYNCLNNGVPVHIELTAGGGTGSMGDPGAHHHILIKGITLYDDKAVYRFNSPGVTTTKQATISGASNQVNSDFDYRPYSLWLVAYY